MRSRGAPGAGLERLRVSSTRCESATRTVPARRRSPAPEPMVTLSRPHLPASCGVSALRRKGSPLPQRLV